MFALTNESPEYIQGSDEWLKLRKSKITATDAAAILGISPWKTALQLYHEKKSDEKPKPPTPAMQRGTDLEPVARELFCIKTGHKMEPKVIVKDWLMASLDGINAWDEILEIKCPLNKDPLLEKEGKIPDHYYAQMQHQMYVCDSQKAFYFCFDGVDGVTVEVKRDDAFIEKMLDKEWEFYQCLKNNTPPEATERDLVYKEKDDDTWKSCASQWKELNETIKSLETKQELLRRRLIFLSGESNSRGAGIALAQVKRKGALDYAKMVKKLALENSIVESFRNPPTTSWRITCQ